MKSFRILSVIFGLMLIIIVVGVDLGMGSNLLLALYKITPYADKISHFMLMGLMSFFLNLGFRSSRVSFLPVTKASLIFFAVVAIEEVTQIFFANRTVSWQDLSADIAGIFLLGELGTQLGNIMIKRNNLPKEQP